MGAYENFRESYEKSSFVEKIKFVKEINWFSNALGYEVDSLYWYGYLRAIDEKCVSCDDGEYYVYLWRHVWGDPFYVGSGKNDRWLSKNGRCDDFYLHLDQGDAVVYKILKGVDSQTARLFEKYVSVNLIEAGYTLANGDNNPEYMTDAARGRRIKECEKIDDHELAPMVQNTILSVLNEHTKCDYRVTDAFLMKYGVDYFSRNYMGRNKRENDRRIPGRV